MADEANLILGHFPVQVALAFSSILILLGFKLQLYRRQPFQANSLRRYFAPLEEEYDTLYIVRTHAPLNRIMTGEAIREAINDAFRQDIRGVHARDVMELFPADIIDEILLPFNPPREEVALVMDDLDLRYPGLTDEQLSDTFLISGNALLYVINAINFRDHPGATLLRIIMGPRRIPRLVRGARRRRRPVDVRTPTMLGRAAGDGFSLFQSLTIRAMRVEGEGTSLAGLDTANAEMVIGPLDGAGLVPNVAGYDEEGEENDGGEGGHLNVEHEVGENYEADAGVTRAEDQSSVEEEEKQEESSGDERGGDSNDSEAGSWAQDEGEAKVEDGEEEEDEEDYDVVDSDEDQRPAGDAEREQDTVGNDRRQPLEDSGRSTRHLVRERGQSLNTAAVDTVFR